MGTAFVYLKAKLGENSTTTIVELFKAFEALIDDLIEMNDQHYKDRYEKAEGEDTYHKSELRSIMKHKDRPAFVFVSIEDKDSDMPKVEVPDMSSDFNLNHDEDYIYLDSEVSHMTCWNAIAQWFKDQGHKADYTFESEVDIYESIHLD